MSEYSKSIARVWPYIKQQNAKLTISAIASVFIALADVGTAKLVQPFVDNLNTGEGLNPLYVPLIIIALALLKSVSRYAQEYTSNTAGWKIVINLRNTTFKHILKLHLNMVDKTTTGDLLSRLVNDIGTLKEVLTSFTIRFIRDILSIIMLAGLAFYTDWLMTFVAMIVLPIAIYPIARFSKKLKNVVVDGQDKLGEVVTNAEQSLKCIRVIKSHVAEQHISKKFEEENELFYNIYKKGAKIQAAIPPVVEILAGIGIALVMWIGIYRINAGGMTQGEFFSILAALTLLYGPAKRLGAGASVASQAAASIERVFNLLDIKPEPTTRTSKRKSLKGALELRNVSFRYDDSTSNDFVVNKISLSIRQGEHVALIGKSGSGKTTIANLISGLYQPTEGQILFDGTETESLGLETIRQNIGYLDQNPLLFNGTVRDNLTLGFKHDDADVWEAMKRANVDNLFKNEQGLDTLLTEHGNNLSGGEKQRLAIARLLLKKAPILILDEPTSALDTYNQKAIHQEITELTSGVTTITIAHRLETVKNADTIIVLSEGTIEAKGRHSDLFDNSETYRELLEELVEG